MDMCEYIKAIEGFDNQIKELQNQKLLFIRDNLDAVEKSEAIRKAKDRADFIINFNKLYENLEQYKNQYNSPVIDYLNVVVQYFGCGCGRSLNKIRLKNLIRLWENGFSYLGYPVIEYKEIKGVGTIRYMRNGALIETPNKLDRDVIKKAFQLQSKH